ncbi:HHL095Cp [Eremothecium sinecaudum]|uniref:ER membrane protein complex subunit 4 n=1 Tax=Eremothecium sinecaudum TaxID=45286 RepID=A0A0X8HWB6_9SACH|nr:HHL095Cp [Eremothecium sinecaudum]AMD22675.1 HHL095Cp [Eremothecium sinecaudum]
MASCNIPQWARNLTDPNYHKSITIVSSNTLPSPPGYSKKGELKNVNASKREERSNTEHINSLQISKAWQLALAPAKNIPMNIFMSYMSGTSLQVIPLMTALMLLSGPIKSVASIRSTFRGLLDNNEIYANVIAAMFMYVLFQCVLMAIGLQKLNSMGLLPNTKSDWLAWESPMAYNIKAYAF